MRQSSLITKHSQRWSKLCSSGSQEGGQNSELIIKDTVGCQNWLLGHEAVKSVFHISLQLTIFYRINGLKRSFEVYIPLLYIQPFASLALKKAFEIANFISLNSFILW